MKKNEPAQAVSVFVTHVFLGIIDAILFLFAVLTSYLMISMEPIWGVVAFSELILWVPLVLHAYFLWLTFKLYARRKYNLSLMSHGFMYVIIIFLVICVQFLKILPPTFQFIIGVLLIILTLGYAFSSMRRLRKEATQFGPIKDKNEKTYWQLWKNQFFKQFVFGALQLFLGILDLAWVWFSVFGLAMLGGSPASRESLLQSIIIVLFFFFYLGYSVMLSIFLAVIGKRRWSLLAHSIPLLSFIFLYEMLKGFTSTQLEQFNPYTFFALGVPFTAFISFKAYKFSRKNRSKKAK